MQLLRCLRTTAHCSWCNSKTTTSLLILLLLQLLLTNSVTAERTCHQCRDINCQRTSYEAIEKCTNDLDICVSVFDGQTIQAQGCLEQLSEELRAKCSSNGQANECHKCNSNLCNNLASSSFECVQCDSNTDTNCRSDPSSLKPSRCLISRTPNEYCFVKQDGTRVIRGCSSTLEEQKSCLSSEGCMICQPSELSGCNSIEIKSDDSGSGGEGSGGGGSSGDGGSGSGSGGGSGGGSGNEGSGSGSGGGSGSGSGNEGSGSGSGGGSGNGSGGGGSSGDGESGSGSGGGSGDGGSGGTGTKSLNIHIFILIINIMIIYSLRK